MNKRTPYYITLRRMATGTDYSSVLYLHSATDAFEAACRFVRYHGLKRNELRLVSCETATAEQVAAHKARLVAC